ncbi:hypothetical protein [Vibrio navarrensis]|uniref:hypothetical protein n=1 Tax=Vibrio navarrensis TaxID=29495 RepID=UPI001869E8F9|nr:hypothetical protein [Vibrio navarrensis]MBE4619075.1 hypothetical protein [Vibrio navarrensis]
MIFSRTAISLSFLLLITSCATTNNKNQDQLIFDATINKNMNTTMDAIRNGKYSDAEIKIIAQKAIENNLCTLAYVITSEYQLSPNFHSEHQTLFQCLMLNKEFTSALSILQQGANPDFIKEANYERNDALEEAAAWGEIGIVEELLKLGKRPSNKAFYVGISGHYHSDYEKSLKFFELFKPFIVTIDLNHSFAQKPLLYEVLVERKYNLAQRLQLAKLLLENGADPNAGIQKTVHGSELSINYTETAFMAVKGAPELTALLLAHGANPKFEIYKDKAYFLASLKRGDIVSQGIILDFKNSLILVQEENGQRWMTIDQIDPV